MKRIIMILLLTLVTIGVTGCVDVGQFDLTEDEQNQISGYIADVLLKYDGNHMSNVVDTAQKRELYARVEAVKEMRQAAEAEKASDSKKDKKGDGDSKDTGKGAYSPSGTQNLAEAMGQSGFNVKYKGYEVCSSYPNDGSVSSFFSMDATIGKQLLVFHFDIENTTAEDKQCTFLSSDPFYRIIINNGERKNALTTLLENDLATVDTLIAGGGHYDAVVVLETEPGYESSISSLSLLAKYSGGESVIPLE